MLYKLSNKYQIYCGTKLKYYDDFLVGSLFIFYALFFLNIIPYTDYCLRLVYIKLIFNIGRLRHPQRGVKDNTDKGIYLKDIDILPRNQKIPFSFSAQSSKVRFYSTKPNKTTFKDSKDITADVLNKLLKNQGVCITEAELTRIKSIPGVRFNLPLNDQTSHVFEALVGKTNTRDIKAGVYIFTHIASGAKYVGSSNSLARRLDQYFSHKHFNQKNSGLLIPLILKDGFEAFNLEVMVVPENVGLDLHDSNNLNFNFSYLFLEQFYLLQDKFNLNTQRIVNFRVSQGKAIYIYSLNGKVLYYCGYSLNVIRGVLGIHYNTCTNCIKTGKSYLNFFTISTEFKPNAKKSKLSTQELVDLIGVKFKEILKTSSSAKFSKAVIIRKEDQEQTLEFSSITMAVKYLKDLGITADRNQIAKHLDTNKSYKGYIFSKS